MFPNTFATLSPCADSPASAQDLLSRIKQEEPPCVWDQQDLAERDIPTDPNSGEQGARMKIGGTVASQLTFLTFGKSTSD